jgi:predicted dithiol-disulfide oxidoreductase (DUF899 family)
MIHGVVEQTLSNCYGSKSSMTTYQTMYSGTATRECYLCLYTATVAAAAAAAAATTAAAAAAAAAADSSLALELLSRRLFSICIRIKV